MGEMLATGLPIVTNAGVGDVERMIEDMGCGAAIKKFEAASYGWAIGRLQSLRGTPQDRRDRALPWFDVNIGIARYAAVYSELLRPQATQ
jgi:hypothetical protein